MSWLLQLTRFRRCAAFVTLRARRKDVRLTFSRKGRDAMVHWSPKVLAEANFVRFESPQRQLHCQHPARQSMQAVNLCDTH